MQKENNMSDTKTWTELFGSYKGIEFIVDSTIVRPMNQWGSIDSNNKYYAIIYKADNESQASMVLDAWKNETVGVS